MPEGSAEAAAPVRGAIPWSTPPWLPGLLGYLVLSAIFSWPAVCFRADTLVTRHFDLLPAIWLLERAPGTFPGMLHTASAWPFGESLARVDSYLLLGLAWLNGGRVPAWVLANLFTWLGPVANALAAEFCARRAMAVPRPWSWIAGCVFGFSGIAATAILEGHVYHVLNPWLPLLCFALLRGTAPDGRWFHGLLAGVFFVLGLFTTAYFGVASALLAALLLLRVPGRALRLVPGLALPAFIGGGYYLWLFSLGGRWADGQVQPELFLRMGSVALSGLLVWSDAADLRLHSIATPVGFLPFWLLLLAPVLLWRQRGWRSLLLLACFAVLVAMGRTVRVHMDAPGYYSPLALLAGLPGVAFFRFPVRLMWVYYLAAGLVSAQVLAALAAGVGRRWVWPVLALTALECLLLTGLPLRVHRSIAEIPSAYALAPPDKPVLDLFGVAFDRSSGEAEMWARNLSCYYQGSHGRPIFEVCIGTGIDSPREVLDRWLSVQVLQLHDSTAAEGSTSPTLLTTRLAELGVGAVALHADFYRPGDRDALLDGLSDALGEPAASTADGGERVYLFLVPVVPGVVALPGRAYGAALADLR